MNPIEKAIREVYDGAKASSVENTKRNIADLLLDSDAFICTVRKGDDVSVFAYGSDMELLVLLETTIKNFREDGINDALIKTVLKAAWR